MTTLLPLSTIISIPRRTLMYQMATLSDRSLLVGRGADLPVLQTFGMVAREEEVAAQAAFTPVGQQVRVRARFRAFV